MHNLDNWVRHNAVTFFAPYLNLHQYGSKDISLLKPTIKSFLNMKKRFKIMGSCYCWWWASLQSKNNNFVTSLLWPAPLCTFPFPTMPVNTKWKQSSIPYNSLSRWSFFAIYILCWSLYSMSMIFTNIIFLKQQTRKKEIDQIPPSTEQTIFRTFMLMEINVTSTIIYMKNWETSFIRILL